MLERNSSETFAKSGKLHPERWYDMDRSLRLNIVLTYESRVYDAVLQGGSKPQTFLEHPRTKNGSVFQDFYHLPRSIIMNTPMALCSLRLTRQKRVGCS
jgi:hypothetical protein